MPDQTRDFERLVGDLRERVGYRELLTPYLREKKLPTATGWDAFIGKFSDLDAKGQSALVDALKELHGGLVLAGTKDVFLFDLTEDDVAAIAKEVEEVVPSASAYRDAFPFPLSATQLAGQDQDHCLVERTVQDNGDVSFIFAARRRYQERVTYKIDEVTDAVKTAFAGFDEFIGLRGVDYQIFDVVTIRPHLRRLEVLVDDPVRAESTDDRRMILLGRLSMLLPALSHIYEADTPMDLGPCISSMYHNAHEGRVISLKFRSPSGSVNRGLVPGLTDLRNDDFHHYGVKGVGTVTPYDVSIAWDHLEARSGTVTVQLGTTLSGMAANDPVRRARLTDAQSDKQVVAVLNKLVSYSTGS